MAKALSFQAGGFLRGWSSLFATNTEHSLSPGGILHSEVALHFDISQRGAEDGGPSAALKLATLRSLLEKGLAAKHHLTKDSNPVDMTFADLASGKKVLAVQATTKEHIASLIVLKRDLNRMGGKPRLVLLGAHEGHLIAKELANAEVPVVMPQATFPVSRSNTWLVLIVAERLKSRSPHGTIDWYPLGNL